MLQHTITFYTFFLFNINVCTLDSVADLFWIRFKLLLHDALDTMVVDIPDPGRLSNHRAFL